MGWERENLENFPKVHCKFLAKDVNGDDLVEYRIQDLEDDRHEDVIQHMLKFFLPDEPVFATRKVIDDPICLTEMTHAWRKVLEERVSLVCYKEGSTEIVSVNILHVSTIKEPSFEATSETLQDMITLVKYVSDQVKLFEKHNVDKYLCGFGLSVDPNYRKRGIATEMLKARKSLLAEVGLTLTSTSFTAVGSQKAALAAGFTLNFEVLYSDLPKINPRLSFPNIKSPSFQDLSLKV